tara:strand:- start:194 stop:466 length:273 start_codon:yes stop_codon:yes gene_type:complete
MSIFIYNEPVYLPWWIFVVLPLIAVLWMLMFHQELFLHNWPRGVYPEIEELKKEKVTPAYLKSQRRKLLIELIVITLTPAVAYVIYYLTK